VGGQREAGEGSGVPGRPRSEPPHAAGATGLPLTAAAPLPTNPEGPKPPAALAPGRAGATPVQLPPGGQAGANDGDEAVGCPPPGSLRGQGRRSTGRTRQDPLDILISLIGIALRPWNATQGQRRAAFPLWEPPTPLGPLLGPSAVIATAPYSPWARTARGASPPRPAASRNLREAGARRVEERGPSWRQS